MFAYVHSHAHIIWSYVCELRCGNTCVHPFTGGIVYMFVYACLYAYIVCVYVCMHMYVSIRNFMSVCERCM